MPKMQSLCSLATMHCILQGPIQTLPLIDLFQCRGDIALGAVFCTARFALTSPINLWSETWLISVYASTQYKLMAPNERCS